MRYRASLGFCVLIMACSEPPQQTSRLDVTFVDHTEVKRQSIGNCWLYAHSTWLESMLKSSTGEDLNVSESYWTYWDLYRKLMASNELYLDELNSGGSWRLGRSIIDAYGWVEEAEFIAGEELHPLSIAQLCAANHIKEELLAGGRLDPTIERTSEQVRAVLDEGFSCGGFYRVDMNEALLKSRKAQETMLKDRKSGEEKSLETWLDEWQQIAYHPMGEWEPYEGKKLPTAESLAAQDQLATRIMRALNDHQPVVLTLYITFNAPDPQGLFNLTTLSEIGDMGTTGGHLLVLHDYAVENVPGIGSIGEGAVDPSLKELAPEGDLVYLVAKNSWGYDRDDRPWLGKGYSRFTWDYLTKSYYDAKNQRSYPFLQNVILPPGY